MKSMFTHTETFTDLEAQREYVEANQRGVGFAAHGLWPKVVWHYLFSAAETFSPIREKYGPAKAYLFSLTEDDTRGAITPIQDTLNWTKVAQQVNRQLFPDAPQAA